MRDYGGDRNPEDGHTDKAARIREIFDSAMKERYSDTGAPDGWKAAYVKSMSGPGNSAEERKDAASMLLSIGDECAAARVLSGKSLLPSDYSWILGNIIRHDLAFNPYVSAKQMEAYVQKFMTLR